MALAGHRSLFIALILSAASPAAAQELMHFESYVLGDPRSPVGSRLNISRSARRLACAAVSKCRRIVPATPSATSLGSTLPGSSLGTRVTTRL
jgi:hypothetical protein